MSDAGKILRTYAMLGATFEEGQKKTENTLDLKVGQIVKTMGRQIAVPDWHEVDCLSVDRTVRGMQKGGNMPCIRLALSPRGENYCINTGLNIWSGLVCFVPVKYLGMAILSVRITKLSERSVTAEPVEWIEVNPLLNVSAIGSDAQDLFDAYMSEGIEHVEVKAVWGKEV